LPGKEASRFRVDNPQKRSPRSFNVAIILRSLINLSHMITPFYLGHNRGTKTKMPYGTKSIRH
jgi:hypothetical protein